MSAVRLPVRHPVAGRRSRPVSRQSSAVNRWRLLGALGMAATAASFYWLSGDPRFALDTANVRIEGARYTDANLVRQRMGLVDGTAPNVFRLATEQMRADIEALPAVLSADVRATLPDRLAVTIKERTPVLAWRLGSSGWLVDVEGVLFAQADPAMLADPNAGATGSALPVVDDQRPTDAALTAGMRLDATELEAVLLLGGLTADTVGSDVGGLRLSVDAQLGFVLRAPGAWTAVFGFYTPELRRPDLIPQQVQCLGSLLADRGSQVSQVILAVGVDRCGTYTPGGSPATTPAASATPVASIAERTPRPGRSQMP